MRNIAQAKQLLKATRPNDAKFEGRWKDHYTGKFMWAQADDDTYAIAAATGWNPLAVGIGDFDYSADVDEKPNLVLVLASGEMHFTDGLYESYRQAVK